MRNLMTLKTYSVCLMVLAAVACRGPAGNNVSGDQINAAAANEVAPPPAESSAASNNAAPVEPAAAPTAYQGFGTEPYWTLTIGGGRMRYEPADGRPVSEPLPAQTPIANGYRYAGRQMTVEVVHRTCQEAGEDSYPDEIHMRVGSQTLNGCGGRAGELG